jgi:hypothetical protein
MHKSYLTSIVVGLFSLAGFNSAQANGTPTTVGSTVDLNFTKTIWEGRYYMSFLNFKATNTEQEQDSSNEPQGLLAGQVVSVRLNNQSVLDGVSGKLVVVWDGPAGDTYPYLAAYNKGQALTKRIGWSIESQYIEEPFNPNGTVQGAIKLKQSPTLYVPATDDPNVPKDQQKATGYTFYTFGIKDTTPANEISGWGTYTADFKKLFRGKAKLTGSVDQVTP